jgi:hypothetical protein
MHLEGPPPHARAALRRPVATEVALEVVLCGGASFRARVVDEQGGSLGLLVHGEEAHRALAHRDCCAGTVVTLRIPARGPGAPRTPREVPAQLVHVSALDDGAKVGIGFLVSCLQTKHVHHLLALWESLHDPAGDDA